MKPSLLNLSIKFLLLTSLAGALTFTPLHLPVGLPITGGDAVIRDKSEVVIPALADFIATVKNGHSKQIVGVYVPEVLALKVAQQPANNPGYVTRLNGYVTQFGPAIDYGTTALLAHNYRSGALFFNLLAGQEVNIIYGDGVLRVYTISAFRHLQAIRPTDPYSNFLDLDNGNQRVLNADLFYEIYAVGDQVVFQTCIATRTNRAWGRLFVIATPN